MKTSYRKKWILYDTLGIFLGIAVATGILSFESMLMGSESATLAEKVINLGVAVVGGLLAGSILAWFQYTALKHRYPELSWTGWWGNTTLAFIAGWILAIVPSLAFTGANSMVTVVPPFGVPLYTALFGSILFGGLLGAFIGYAQWLKLRKYRKRAGEWVSLNVFGWAQGLFLIVLTGILLQEPTLLTTFLLSGVGGGLVAAVCIALITSMFFVRPPAAEA